MGGACAHPRRPVRYSSRAAPSRASGARAHACIAHARRRATESAFSATPGPVACTNSVIAHAGRRVDTVTVTGGEVCGPNQYISIYCEMQHKRASRAVRAPTQCECHTQFCVCTLLLLKSACLSISSTLFADPRLTPTPRRRSHAVRVHPAFRFGIPVGSPVKVNAVPG